MKLPRGADSKHCSRNVEEEGNGASESVSRLRFVLDFPRPCSLAEPLGLRLALPGPHWSSVPTSVPSGRVLITPGLACRAKPPTRGARLASLPSRPLFFSHCALENKAWVKPVVGY